MEIKKSAEQIIRDDMRRKRLRRVGLGIFFFGILFVLGIKELHWGGGDVAGGIGLTSLGVTLAGCIMAAVSWKYPICDSAIYKSGAYECQPSRTARSAYIDNLKLRADGPKPGGGT